MAPCPVHLAKGKRVLVNYDCPESGWPTHYSRKEWEEDEEKWKYIPRLREANEDEHDLRSGRDFPEYTLPGAQAWEEVINFSSWDVFFYTRAFGSIESERSRRHVTKLLTFPTTIAGVLHENGPYHTRNRRMTREGTRSFLALRQLLHPKLGDRPSLESVRVFIVGARSESTLPTTVWDQLRFMFPGVHFHLYMIGPEVVLPNWNPLPFAPKSFKKTASADGTDLGRASGKGKESELQAQQRKEAERQANMALGGLRDLKTRSSDYGPKAPSKTFVLSDGLTATYIRCNYEDVHHQLEPFDPYTDVFFAFSPGFGFPSPRAYNQAQAERRAKQEEEEAEKKAKGESSGEAEKKDDTTVAHGEAIGKPPSDPASDPTARKTSYVRGKPQQIEVLDPIAADIETAAELGKEQASSSSSSGERTPPIGSSYSTLPTLQPILQSQCEWAEALTQMLSTKCPIVITGFSPADVRRDVEAFETVEGIKGEFEWLIPPGENVFGSQEWNVADFDPRVAIKTNWGIWAVRGKRYDLLGPGAYVNLNPFSEDKNFEEDEEDEIAEIEEEQEPPKLEALLEEEAQAKAEQAAKEQQEQRREKK